MSVQVGYLKFLKSYRFLVDSLDKSFTTLLSSRTLDEKRMKDEMFRRNLAYPYEKGQTIDTVKPPKLRGKMYFSALKES